MTYAVGRIKFNNSGVHRFLKMTLRFRIFVNRPGIGVVLVQVKTTRFSRAQQERNPHKEEPRQVHHDSSNHKNYKGGTAYYETVSI